MHRLPVWLALGILVGGCTEGRLPTVPAPPRLTGVSAAPNPLNSLSFLMSFQTDGADSARVVYAVAGQAEQSTPWTPVGTSDSRLPVLGLKPATTYGLRVEVAGPGGRVVSDTLVATTGEAPAAIRGLTLQWQPDPVTGYTLVVPVGYPSDVSNGYLLAFDGSGALCWYREFDGGGWGVEAKQLSDGNFSVYLGRSYGYQAADGHYVEITPDGQPVDSFRVGQPSFTDPHEMLLSLSGSATEAIHLIGYDVSTVDLSAYGGSATAQLAMHFIERQGPSGTLEFRWNAADHYLPADWPAPATQAKLAPDLVHPSSLEIDRDGNYIVSLQAMDEIAKIDAQNGVFIWRLGGSHNQFRIDNDPLGGFQGQHDVRMLEDGHLLLLDDRIRSAPSSARAVEYALNTQNMTATLVWQYQPNPPVTSPIMGSVQRLSNGNTVVGFGFAGRVDEVDPAGNLLAQASLHGPGVASIEFYRALRVPSLYRFERP